MGRQWIRADEFEDGSYIESRGGVMWYRARRPCLWHRCRPQTRGTMSGYTERCACGSIRKAPGDPWTEKNARRAERGIAGRRVS